MPHYFAKYHTVHFARPVKVMTQNLSIGADINRVLGAQRPEEIPGLVAEPFAIIEATNFPERAEALADQVARFRPHVIGLQEAVLFRRQSPGDFVGDEPLPAEAVTLDYLAILLDGLAARGLHYTVAAEVTTADIELPIFAGIAPDGTPLLDDLHFVGGLQLVSHRPPHPACSTTLSAVHGHGLYGHMADQPVWALETRTDLLPPGGSHARDFDL